MYYAAGFVESERREVGNGGGEIEREKGIFGIRGSDGSHRFKNGYHGVVI